MFNLLPETSKEIVRKEYRFRIWTTFVLMMTISLLFLIIIFLPIYFVSKNIHNSLDHEISNLKNNAVLVDYKAMVDELDSSNKEVSTAKAEIGKRLDLQAVISAVEDVRPSNIQIYRFAFSTSGGVQKIFLTGEAKSREALKDFSTKLNGLSQFESVDLPLSSFTKSTEVDFSVTLIIKDKQDNG